MILNQLPDNAIQAIPTVLTLSLGFETAEVAAHLWVRSMLLLRRPIKVHTNDLPPGLLSFQGECLADPTSQGLPRIDLRVWLPSGGLGTGHTVMSTRS